MRLLVDNYRYERIRQLEIFREAWERIPEGSELVIVKKIIGITALGESFRKACVTEPDKTGTYPLAETDQ